MEPLNSVLLYSNYSHYSKKLFQMVSSLGIGDEKTVLNSLNIKTVCVDNKHIRERIINDKKLEISNVPCLLLFYQKGSVEKYVDRNLFSWFEEVLSTLTEPEPEPEPEFIPEPKTEKPVLKVAVNEEEKKDNVSTSIDDILSDDDEEKEFVIEPEKKGSTNKDSALDVMGKAAAIAKDRERSSVSNIKPPDPNRRGV